MATIPARALRIDDVFAGTGYRVMTFGIVTHDDLVNGTQSEETVRMIVAVGEWRMPLYLEPNAQITIVNR